LFGISILQEILDVIKYIVMKGEERKEKNMKRLMDKAGEREE
jgi:hypothetical protein